MSAPQQTIRNATFASLRSSGWLARLDRVALVSGNQTASLVDLITKQTYTVTGTMPFTTNQGFTSDGSTGVIDTGFFPNAPVHQFTQNLALYGCAISSTRASGAVMCVMGTSSDNTSECRIYPFYTGNQSFTSLNAQFSSSTATPPSVHGIYMENRPDATHMVYYQNTTALRNDGVTAIGLDSGSFLIGATHTGGVAADFSTDTIAGWWIGQGASGDADQAVLEGIIFTDLHGMGAL